MAGKSRGTVRGTSKTAANSGPRHLLALDRARRALEMRKAGASFPQIAQSLNISTGAAYKSVQRGLREMLAQPAAEVRELEVARLDQLILTLWSKATGGDVDAIDRVLRIMERRARLLGLDAPREVKIDVQELVRSYAEQLGLDPDEAVREAQAIVRGD